MREARHGYFLNAASGLARAGVALQQPTAVLASRLDADPPVGDAL